MYHTFYNKKRSCFDTRFTVWGYGNTPTVMSKHIYFNGGFKRFKVYCCYSWHIYRELCDGT